MQILERGNDRQGLSREEGELYTRGVRPAVRPDALHAPLVMPCRKVDTRSRPICNIFDITLSPAGDVSEKPAFSQLPIFLPPFLGSGNFDPPISLNVGE